MFDIIVLQITLFVITAIVAVPVGLWIYYGDQKVGTTKNVIPDSFMRDN